MNLVKRAMYHSLSAPVRLYERLFMDVHVWGREHIPAGPKLYVLNHITAIDPLLLTFLPGPLHVVIGPGYRRWWMARAYDAMEQINAMPAHRATVVDRAVAYLAKGEAVYIAPEGDMQEPCRLGTFYPGAARIYRRSRAPVVPIGIVAPKHRMRELPITTNVNGRIYRTVIVPRGPFCVNIGRPLSPDIPDGDEAQQDEQITELLKQTIGELIRDACTNKFWQTPRNGKADSQS